MKRWIKKLWFKFTKQRGWLVFTATQTFKIIGKEEPPPMAGETARTEVSPWL